MADIDLKVKSTYEGKSQTLTISDANPQASDAVLLEFGQRVTALTDNEYASTDKVTTINLDTESSKATPTLQFRSGGSGTTVISEMEITSKGTSSGTSKNIYYDGDGEVYYKVYPEAGDNSWLFFTTAKATPTENLIPGFLMASSNAADGTYYIDIYSTETANYKAATWRVTVTLTTS